MLITRHVAETACNPHVHRVWLPSRERVSVSTSSWRFTPGYGVARLQRADLKREHASRQGCDQSNWRLGDGVMG